MKNYLRLFALAILVIGLEALELDKVKIIPEFKERFVRIGDSLSAKCYVTTGATDTSSKLEWEKPSDNGVSITKRTELTENAKMYKLSGDLSIRSITKAHLGQYKCTYGSLSASFDLRSPTEDKITANFTFGVPSATLSCNISGDAASKTIDSVVWLKNDTLVSKLSDADRFTEIPENNTLVISEPTRDDADLYVARFTFKDMARSYDCGVQYSASPKVVKFDKSKNLIEDDNMELHCKVKGYPRATVTWLKNNKVLNITDDKRISQTSLNGYENARLVIEGVEFDDAGDYTCTAFSGYFNESESKTLAVRVKDKLAALWPFLGIVAEVVILCLIIFIYEKRRNKQAENEANTAQDVDSSSLKKEGVRHRGGKK